MKSHVWNLKLIKFKWYKFWYIKTNHSSLLEQGYLAILEKQFFLTLAVLCPMLMFLSYRAMFSKLLFQYEKSHVYFICYLVITNKKVHNLDHLLLKILSQAQIWFLLASAENLNINKWWTVFEPVLWHVLYCLCFRIVIYFLILHFFIST